MARKKKGPTISLVGWVEDQDLRKVCQRATFLRKTARDWNLDEGQGVLYTNLAMNRFRVVALLGGMPCLIVMPVAAQRSHLLSLYLQISLTLRNAWGMDDEIRVGLSEMEEKRAKRGIKAKVKNPKLRLVA